MSRFLMFVCAAGGIACAAALVILSLRGVLREACERLSSAGLLTKSVVLLAFVCATLFAGAKHGSTTNSPSNLLGRLGGGGAEVERLSGGGERYLPPCASGLEISHNCPPPPLFSTFPSYISNWNARGAYCDWTRVEFPEGFAFPIGTNEIAAVSLMAWGEIRETLAGQSVCSLADLLAAVTNQQPATNNHQPRLSIEPGVSSVTHGLTESNSYLFVWQDCCVNRDATNRVNASIELFRSGDAQVCVQPTTGNEQPTTIFIPAPLPEGFVGRGQDTNWVVSAFTNANDLAAIAEKGYDTWLMEDKVGINEPNGIYKVAVTVAAMPEAGPCYLVVGPYRTVVTHPGTYSFPLEVFEVYHAYTCPTRVPLSFSYDDGYNIGSDSGLYYMNAPKHLGRSVQEELDYEIQQIPPVVVIPSSIELSHVRTTPIDILCNMPGAIKNYWVTTSADFELVFLNQTTAEIIYAASECIVQFALSNAKGTVYGSCELYRNPPYVPPEGTNGVGTAGSTNAPPVSGEP